MSPRRRFPRIGYPTGPESVQPGIRSGENGSGGIGFADIGYLAGQKSVDLGIRSAESGREKGGAGENGRENGGADENGRGGAA